MDVKPGGDSKPTGSEAIQSRKPADAATAAPAKPAAAAVEPAKPAAAKPAPAPSVRRDEGGEALAKALVEGIRKRNRPMVLLTAVLAVGGAISAVIFGLLLHQMQIAAELTREGIRLNKAAVDLARDSAQRQLRAYAGVVEFKCGACGDNAGPDEVFVRAANEGQTPALNIYSRIGWNAGDPRCGAPGSGFDYAYKQARFFRTLRTLSKDARDLTTFDVDRETVQQAKSANSRLCVFGTVNYKTIFTDLGERETRFCYWYTRGSQQAPCEDHNDQN